MDLLCITERSFLTISQIKKKIVASLSVQCLFVMPPQTVCFKMSVTTVCKPLSSVAAGELC